MPGWHEATREFQTAGRLRVLGIVEEQHPSRALLFHQWKGMEWPLLVDSLNLLGVSAVPMTLLIDEHGVVRGKVGRHDRSAEELDAFLAANFDPPTTDAKTARDSPDPRTDDELSRGDEHFLSGDPQRLDDAEKLYRAAHESTGAPEALFRLGVVLRRRYETPLRRPGDFQAAGESWQRALDERPDQYIWRRRIEQYGPRLDKPYAFYDWVGTARSDILRRGELPVSLEIEPRGAEIAHPEKEFRRASADAEHPDPDGRVPSDEAGLVRIETAVLPAKVAPGRAARIHITLRPSDELDAHWNNEADRFVVWIDPPTGIAVDERRHGIDRPTEVTSREPRTVELEVRIPEGATAGPIELPFFALYSVCEDRDGVCYYLRGDGTVRIEVR